MHIDWSILQWIHTNMQCSFLDFIFPKITMLGNSGIIWIIAAIAMICTKKYRKYGVMLLGGLFIGLIVGNGLLKHLIARQRPCWLDTSVDLLIPNPTDYSFPSGHTLSSVISATILTLTDCRFALASVPLAALIAFSRLYLYVHFPSDVVAAILLGLIIGFTVFYAGIALIRHLKEKG